MWNFVMITKTFLETCSKVTAITENNCGKYFQSALREKCPNTEFFWSVFSCIRTRKKLRIWILSRSGGAN